ncbi:DUF3105 domain-containing protein [Nocardioides marmoriginsengisoli]|uniref:DUF3105 domain-containing protein n=1 Tax=Nocardioides marmoriginsengisoli TaxID=661483 RepID=A0A3N0CHM0_9ACTN|nr:DUF3105 domain-containing protein [Nocardioides marmoriginsengisoli]RNL62950.1 DUF3105 domain-containing protein [Nocardioides marmoriginsengisoli]
MTETSLRPTRLRRLAGALAVSAAVATGAVACGGSDDAPEAGGGSTTAPAPCDAVITKPTDENQQHINEPTPITYTDAPPAFGEHRPEYAPFGRAFYSSDRPEVGNLVHSLEHGYTIAWYDDTLAEDTAALASLETIATDYMANRERFIAAPWREEDGAAFPEGRHVALVRWSADADDPTDQTKHRGNWMYCGGVDRKAISTFFDTWPNEESPEPGLP